VARFPTGCAEGGKKGMAEKGSPYKGNCFGRTKGGIFVSGATVKGREEREGKGRAKKGRGFPEGTKFHFV